LPHLPDFPHLSVLQLVAVAASTIAGGVESSTDVVGGNVVGGCEIGTTGA
jgi:hypothetical protein